MEATRDLLRPAAVRPVILGLGAIALVAATALPLAAQPRSSRISATDLERIRGQLVELTDQGAACRAKRVEFQRLLETAILRLEDGEATEDLIDAMRSVHVRRRQACVAALEARQRLRREVAAQSATGDGIYLAGLALRARLAAEVPRPGSSKKQAASRVVPWINVLEDDTLERYFTCYVDRDDECLNVALQRLNIQLASVPARTAYRFGDSFADAAQDVVDEASPKQRAEWIRALGPLTLAVCDHSKYQNVLGGCQLFLARHRRVLEAGTRDDNPLRRQICLFDGFAGSLRCFDSDPEAAKASGTGCLADLGRVLRSFAGLDGTLGEGSCSYLEMAQSCVPGVGPTCPSEVCAGPQTRPRDGSPPGSALSERFVKSATGALGPDQIGAVDDSCRGEGDRSGGSDGGLFMGGDSYCTARTWADNLVAEKAAGGELRACIDNLAGDVSAKFSIDLDPDLGSGCGDPVAQDGPFDDVELTDSTATFKEMLCSLGSDESACVNTTEIEDYFDSPEWGQRKEEFRDLYEAATGVEITDGDFEAAEREAARGRRSETECAEGQTGCTDADDGDIFYNTEFFSQKGRLSGKEKEDERTGSHEALHSAAVRAARRDEGDLGGKSDLYVSAVQHMTMCVSGEAESCHNYEEEKGGLGEEEQEELDQKKKELEEQKRQAEKESGGSTGIPCTDDGCVDACSASMLPAMERFGDCVLSTWERMPPVRLPLDPYIYPDPSRPPTAGLDIDLCRGALDTFLASQGAQCAQVILCPSGETPTSCLNGTGCCCGGALSGAVPATLGPFSACGQLIDCGPGSSPSESGLGGCVCSSGNTPNLLTGPQLQLDQLVNELVGEPAAGPDPPQ